MKLWIGGIIDAVIADDFRNIRNSLEERVNSFIENVDYGDGMSTWDVILVISSTPTNEYVRFNKKNRETDIRKVLQFGLFVESNYTEKNEIIKNALLASLDELKGKNISDFDFLRLKEDFIKSSN